MAKYQIFFYLKFPIKLFAQVYYQLSNHLKLIFKELYMPTWIEIDPLVKMPHLNVAGLFFSVIIWELRQSLWRHTKEINQFLVVSMVAENLNKTLDEPERIENILTFSK